MDVNTDVTSSKRRRIYDLKTKREIVLYAVQHNNNAAARHYSVPESCIRNWRKSLEDNIHTIMKSTDLEDQVSTVSSDINTNKKGSRRRRIHDLETKRGIVLYAIEHGNRAAGRHYSIPESCIRAWRKNLGDNISTPKTSTDLADQVSAALKAILPSSETQTEVTTKAKLKPKELKASNMSNVPWYINLTRGLNRYVNSLRESGDLVLLDEILLKVYDIVLSLNISKSQLEVTEDWLKTFLEHVCSSLNCQMSIEPQISKELQMKLIKYRSFVKQLRKQNKYLLNQIGNVNKIQVFLEFPLEVEKSVTVMLCVTADGGKLKPFIVFKSESVLKRAFPSGVIVGTDENGSMTDALMTEWYKSVWCSRPGAEQNMRGLLTFESTISHLLTEDWLAEGNTDLVIVPRGMTLLPQPLNVDVTKYFKDRFRWQCEKWILSQGKLKSASPSLLSYWIDAAWSEVPEELVFDAFKKCYLSTDLDGAEDVEYTLSNKFVAFYDTDKLPERLKDNQHFPVIEDSIPIKILNVVSGMSGNGQLPAENEISVSDFGTELVCNGQSNLEISNVTSIKLEVKKEIKMEMMEEEEEADDDDQTLESDMKPVESVPIRGIEET